MNRTMLEQAIDDYLLWMISKGYAQGTWKKYEITLRRFLNYVDSKAIPAEAVLIYDTFRAFREENRLPCLSYAVTGLSRYLYEQGRIPQPIKKPQEKLPDIYEEYIAFYVRSRQPADLRYTKRVLSALNKYLQRSGMDIADLRIEHLDNFLAEYNGRSSPSTQRSNRAGLKGFLKYLYQDRGILKKDLAPLVIGAPLFAQAQPPRFLRPQEVQQLFSNFDLSSSHQLRAYAMCHMAFTLGLRPKEIALGKPGGRPCRNCLTC